MCVCVFVLRGVSAIQWHIGTACKTQLSTFFVLFMHLLIFDSTVSISVPCLHHVLYNLYPYIVKRLSKGVLSTIVLEHSF